MSTDWGSLVSDLAAPGGLLAVIVAGVFGAIKIRRLGATPQEQQQAAETVHKASSVELSMLSLARDALEASAKNAVELKEVRALYEAERSQREQRDNELQELSQKFDVLVSRDGIKSAWIRDITHNWALHRLREEPPPLPTYERIRGGENGPVS